MSQGSATLLSSRSHRRSRLLSHLASDEALNEPEIDLLTSVAVVDAILLDYRPLPVRVPASGVRCAVGCLHDFDPGAGLRILEHVTLPDLRQRHLLCYVFRAHYPPGSSR